MSVATIIERLTEKGEKFASGVYVGPNYSKADLLADLRAHEADLREALDALAEVEAGVMTSAKLSAISADATAHLRYSLEPARAILRKHGRLA